MCDSRGALFTEIFKERLTISEGGKYVTHPRPYVLQTWQGETHGREVSREGAFMAMAQSAEMKEFDDIMKGYHELVDSGRREIYKIEG